MKWHWMDAGGGRRSGRFLAGLRWQLWHPVQWVELHPLLEAVLLTAVILALAVMLMMLMDTGISMKTLRP